MRSVYGNVGYFASGREGRFTGVIPGLAPEIYDRQLATGRLGLSFRLWMRQAMSHLKPAVIIGVLVATGIAAVESAPLSMVSWALIFPLFPGIVAGVFFSGHRNLPVAIVSCWIVDTGLYWVLWTMLWRLVRRKQTRGQATEKA